jgi:hypothetical protein
MKMTRRELKGLVKECLVEILSEGLSETQNAINESKRERLESHHVARQNASVEYASNPRKMIAEKISFLPSKSEIKQSQVQAPVQNVRALAGSLTSDPVMADIFADTARSGAHKGMNESVAGRVDHEQMIATAGDAAAKVMLKSDPTDIFGESASKWASLAFSEKIPARS